MPYAPHYAFSAHPPLPLHPKVPRPWALDTYYTVIVHDVVCNSSLDIPPLGTAISLWLVCLATEANGQAILHV